MNVLHIITGLGNGGAEAVLYRINADSILGCRARARIVEEFSVERVVSCTQRVLWGKS